MGKVDKSAKAYRKELAAQGVFYSDDKMAALIKAELGEVREVYDPTCGSGSLLRAFGDEVRKYGQELDEEQLEYCKQTIPNFEGYAGDTLTDNKFSGRKFAAIAANPPFSIPWQPNADDVRFAVAPALSPRSKADWAFILHCLYMLAEGGTAAILCFPGALYRGRREGEIRRWLVEQGVVRKVVQIEGGYFVDTAISTSLLVLHKGYNEGIEMVDHATGLSRQVPIEEVAQNDYYLTVNNYVQEEKEAEAVDMVALEVQARESSKKNLARGIDMAAMVEDMTGLSVLDYIDQLADVIEQKRVLYGKRGG